MAEAAAKKLTVDDIPKRSPLPDGSGDLMAESADAYRILEGGQLTRFGGLASPQKLQLIRTKEPNKHVKFTLVVEPKDPKEEKVEVVLDARCKLEPKTLSGLRVGKHVVKPQGESVIKAVLESDGTDIELVMFELIQSPEDPLLGLIGRSGHKVALAFEDQSEAKGWFLYLSAVLGIMDDQDGNTFQAMCAKHVGGHQAAALGDVYNGLGV